jgi:hypothetical protein
MSSPKVVRLDGFPTGRVATSAFAGATVPQRRNDGNPFRQFDEQVAESGQSIAAVSLKCERRTSPQGRVDGDASGL